MFGNLWICALLCNVICFVVCECFFFFTRVCYQWLWEEGWKLPQKMWCLSSEHRILPFSPGYILLFCPRDPQSQLLQSGWIEEPLLGILIGILNASLSPLTSGPLLSLENVLPLGLEQPKTPFPCHNPPSELSIWPALLFIHPVLSASFSQGFLNILNPAVSPLFIFLWSLFCFLKMFIYLVQSVSCSVVSDLLRPQGLKPVRLLCAWDSPGKSTGAGFHFLLQEIFLTQRWTLGLLHGRWILYCLSHQGGCMRS